MSQRKKKRRARQHKRRLHQQIREDLQATGDLPTTPEGGLRPEVVPPASQQDGGLVELPKLVSEAVRAGWETPRENKIRHVGTLSGIIDASDQPAKIKIAAFNALRLADKDQWERDNPDIAGKARGVGVLKVNNTVNNTVQLGDVFDDIDLIEKQVARILGHNYSATGGGVRADGDPEPVDAAQPRIAQAQPEAD